MKPETSKLLLRRVKQLGNLPAMPSVLQSLSESLSGDPNEAKLQQVAELISYDESLTAQCLRMANSTLFRARMEIDSVRTAVFALGLRRIRDIVYSCSLPALFGSAKKGMSQDVFWRHALATALVCQRLAERLAVRDTDKLYLAGLLHDIGILVNSLLFEEEFRRALDTARDSETPLCEVEQKILGFTHCESGRILADLWKLSPDLASAIEFHHQPAAARDHSELTSLVYLADLLCRLRGLGYGYYEARHFDLASEAPWRVLQKKYPAAATLDLARFTFELDEYATEVQQMVDSVFAVGVAT